MSKTEIIAKVRINFEDPMKTEVIIRKIVLFRNPAEVSIFSLNEKGKWVLKEKGALMCKLPIVIFDNFSEFNSI